MVANNYNTDSIESLGIIGGVREKPSSIGLENHNHTFIEILANAIDEHREGFGNEIIVTKHEDNSISVQDFGRSVPMDKTLKENMPIIKFLMNYGQVVNIIITKIQMMLIINIL